MGKKSLLSGETEDLGTDGKGRQEEACAQQLLSSEIFIVAAE